MPPDEPADEAALVVASGDDAADQVEKIDLEELAREASTRSSGSATKDEWARFAAASDELVSQTASSVPSSAPTSRSVTPSALTARHRRTRSWHGSDFSPDLLARAKSDLGTSDTSLRARAISEAEQRRAEWIESMDAALGAALAAAAVQQALENVSAPAITELGGGTIAPSTSEALDRITEVTEATTGRPTEMTDQLADDIEENAEEPCPMEAIASAVEELPALMERAGSEESNASTIDARSRLAADEHEDERDDTRPLRGEFVKQGQRFPWTWRQRAFQMCIDDECGRVPRLSYYAGKIDEKHIKGSLQLGGVRLPAGIGSGTRWELIFEAADSRRVLLARASSEEERALWVAKANQLLARSVSLE